MTSSIATVLQAATLRLAQQSDSARLDAEILLAQVFNRSRSWLYTWPETLLNDQQTADFNHLIEQRANGIPIAYLTGNKAFWSLDLKVTPDTLIPRPETEMLVQMTLDFLKDIPDAQILDLGTGSGAIALALAYEKPDWHITATDKSEKALLIAKENAQNYKLRNIAFYLSDWFTHLNPKKYHAIISNPPYIDAQDPHLQKGDVRFEPSQALISPEDGFQDLRLLIEQAPNYLISGGLLLLEHGYNQREQIASILYKHHYQNVESWKDIQGHDRISQGIWYS